MIADAEISLKDKDIRSPLGKRLEIYVEPQEKTGGNPDVTKNLNF